MIVLGVRVVRAVRIGRGVRVGRGVRAGRGVGGVGGARLIASVSVGVGVVRAVEGTCVVTWVLRGRRLSAGLESGEGCMVVVVVNAVAATTIGHRVFSTFASIPTLIMQGVSVVWVIRVVSVVFGGVVEAQVHRAVSGVQDV